MRVVIGYFAIAMATWPAFVALLGHTPSREGRLLRIVEAFVPALAWPIMLPLVALARLAADRSVPRPFEESVSVSAAPIDVLVSPAVVKV